MCAHVQVLARVYDFGSDFFELCPPCGRYGGQRRVRAARCVVIASGGHTVRRKKAGVQVACDICEGVIGRHAINQHSS